MCMSVCVCRQPKSKRVIEKANRQHSVLYFRAMRPFRETKSNSSRYVSQSETILFHLTYFFFDDVYKLFITISTDD
jgi:hypothetical protein